MSYTQTQERLSLEEFLNFTETNWTVTKEPLVTQQGWETDSFGIFREDNNAYLGTVGRVYTPTQNRELLELLYQACDNVGINLSRGGFLGNGSRVFYQMEVGNIQIGASQVQRYITVLNTHNGRSPIGFGSTNITVVCRNTFYRALNDLSKVKHTPTSMTRLTILVEAMSEALERESFILAGVINDLVVKKTKSSQKEYLVMKLEDTTKQVNVKVWDFNALPANTSKGAFIFLNVSKSVFGLAKERKTMAFILK